MKRFTETEKWRDPWFQDLPQKLKMFWLYLCDQCDHAGVWTTNFRLAEFQIGDSITKEEALKAFGERIEILSSEKWLLVKFIPFQYPNLSLDCKPHKPVFDSLGNHNLTERYSKGKRSVLVKDKDKDKDKDKEEGCGEKDFVGPLELPKNLDTPRFRSVWDQWIKFRKAGKKVKDWSLVFSKQLEALTEMGEARAIAAINHSIAGGYQGLFEPKASNFPAPNFNQSSEKKAIVFHATNNF